MAEKSEVKVASNDMSIEITFQCHENGNVKLPMKTYHARIHFNNQQEMLEHAGESVRRILQYKWGRSGKFPQGRVVDVDHTGAFQKTDEDLLREMTPNDVERFERLLKMYRSTNGMS